MIYDRSYRAPSPTAAALVRLAAFFVAVASMVVIPVAFYSAATGHVSARSAFETALAAAVITLATTVAARSLDPLRR